VTLGWPRGVPIRDGLLASHVAGARPFGRRLFIKRNALAFIQLIKAPLDRAAVKKPLLPAVVTNEPESSVPDKSLDTSARHPSLPGLARGPRMIEYQESFHRSMAKFNGFWPGESAEPAGTVEANTHLYNGFDQRFGPRLKRLDVATAAARASDLAAEG
jgi:hypothetical protein